MTENVSQVGPQAPVPQKTGKKKWLIGCGIGCLVVLILFIVFVTLGVKYAVRLANEMSSEFVQMGYAKVMAQNIEVTEDVNRPTVYVGQVVKIIGDCSDDVAIVAQMAQVHGKVAGTLYFRGQMITIEPEAHLLGDLDLKCQLATIYGKVDGQILGTYQELKDKREK